MIVMITMTTQTKSPKKINGQMTIMTITPVTPVTITPVTIMAITPIIDNKITGQPPIYVARDERTNIFLVFFGRTKVYFLVPFLILEFFNFFPTRSVFVSFFIPGKFLKIGRTCENMGHIRRQS